MFYPRVDINAAATGEFEDGRTPLSFTCEKGDLNIFSLLLDEKKEEIYDPFSFEANLKVIKQKVVRGSACDTKSKYDITIKSKAAHSKGMSVLHYACKSNNVKVVRLLLKQGGFNIKS